jgi:hypothetical protein
MLLLMIIYTSIGLLILLLHLSRRILRRVVKVDGWLSTAATARFDAASWWRRRGALAARGIVSSLSNLAMSAERANAAQQSDIAWRSPFAALPRSRSEQGFDAAIRCRASNCRACESGRSFRRPGPAAAHAMAGPLRNYRAWPRQWRKLWYKRGIFDHTR